MLPAPGPTERHLFGVAASDWAVRLDPVTSVLKAADTTLTAWDSRVGGTPYDDLQDEAGNAITAFRSRLGQYAFYGPPGVIALWVDGGAGQRELLTAWAALEDAAERAQTAAGAAEVARLAVESLPTTTDGLVAGAFADPESASHALGAEYYRGVNGGRPVGQGDLTISAIHQAGATMSAKIGNAVKAAMAMGARHASVTIPAGEWDITPSTFSDLGATTQTGLHIQGAGRESTRLRLITGGVESWFYDNGGSQRVNFASFSDVCFTTDDTTGQFGNGFKITSTGHEQGWYFTNCVFRGPLRRAFQTEGNVGADTIYLNHCRLLQVHDACLYLNNPQSVLHQWTAVNAELIYGDIVKVGPNGGGDFKWFGGSLIMTNKAGDTTPHWLFSVTPSNNVGSGNGTFMAIGVRAEMRSAYSGFVHSLGDLGGAVFDFDKCNLAGFSGAPTGPHDVVVIGRDRQVRFRDCIIPDEFTYRLDVNPGNGITTTESDIIFEGSHVPLDLSDKIAYTQSPALGRASTKGCRARVTTLAERVAIDFDLNWVNSAAGSYGVPVKRAVLKFALGGWPNTTGAERTMKLPKDAIITGIRVIKPASGSSTAAYQLAVGNSDKSATYASSTAGQFKDAHTITRNDLWIECGSSTNGRTVRLWAAATGDGSAQIGGVAVIEYL